MSRNSQIDHGQHLFLGNGCSGEKHNFREASVRKRAIADASDDFIPPLTNRQALRVRVKDEPSDILSGHHGELLSKQRFEICEDDMGPGLIIILYGYYLYNPFPQLDG